MNKGKIKKLAVIVTSITLFASGCGNKLKEGEIYDKQFSPAHSDVILTPIIHSNGKDFTTTYIPITHYYPDRWCVRIKSFERNEKGEYQVADYYTTKEVFDACNVGDVFIYDPERDYDSEPVIKRMRRE